MAIIKNPPMLAVGDGAETWDGNRVLNGVVEAYLSKSGTINANTFVQFVNEMGNSTTSLGALNATSYSSYSPMAYQLSPSKVFILASGGGSDAFYGVVCTVNGTSISKGSFVQIPVYGPATRGNVVVLDESKVVVCGRNKAGISDTYTNGHVCTISGNSITIGTATALAPLEEASGAYGTSMTKISDDKIFFIFVNKSSIYNYSSAKIISINGKTITSGTGVALSMAFISTILTAILSDSAIFCGGNDNNIFGGVTGKTCTVDGDVISVHTSTTIIPNDSSGGPGRYSQANHLIALGSSKIFLPFGVSTTNDNDEINDLYGIVVTVDNNLVTAGTLTGIILNGNQDGYSLSPVAIDESRVFIAHSHSSSGCNGIVCEINGTTITKGSDIALAASDVKNQIAMVLNPSKVYVVRNTLSAYIYLDVLAIDGVIFSINSSSQLGGATYVRWVDALLLSNGRVFATYYDTSSIPLAYALVRAPEEMFVSPATSTPFDGLTRTKCTTAIPGEVWVANLDSLIK